MSGRANCHKLARSTGRAKKETLIFWRRRDEESPRSSSVKSLRYPPGSTERRSCCRTSNRPYFPRGSLGTAREPPLCDQVDQNILPSFARVKRNRALHDLLRSLEFIGRIRGGRDDGGRSRGPTISRSPAPLEGGTARHPVGLSSNRSRGSSFSGTSPPSRDPP
jgi:hypothetical protein